MHKKFLLGLLIALIALLTACGGGQSSANPEVTSSVQSSLTAPAEPAVGAPARVNIPALTLDEPLVALGLEASGAMQLPEFGETGWYAEGPRPGDAGPAVIAAHVDDRSGPDIFYRLHELKKGDRIKVTDENDKDYFFKVTHKEVTDKDELDVEKIWGATDGPELRLITCGGSFNRSTGHYESNVTVYAKLL